MVECYYLLTITPRLLQGSGRHVCYYVRSAETKLFKQSDRIVDIRHFKRKTFITSLSWSNLKMNIRARLKILMWKPIMTTSQECIYIYTFDNFVISHSLSVNYISYIGFHIRILSWALIFILRWRFPPGQSLARIVMNQLHICDISYRTNRANAFQNRLIITPTWYYH